MIRVNIFEELNIFRTKRYFETIIVVFALVVFILLLILFLDKSLATVLNNDVSIEENSELIYYLKVSYDGIDKNGVVSNASTVSEINSRTIFVEDKLPGGLIFSGFVTTSSGSIGAVKRSDGSICSGLVVDDTNSNGVWNSNNTEYTYHGLHYNVNNNTITFKVKDLQAGCDLTVGVITEAGDLDDVNTSNVELRRDFYNYFSAREREFTVNSNTVHVFMGDENISLYNVYYEYTGIVPEGIISPSTTSYAPNSFVNMAANTNVEGYTFSGWTTNDVIVTDGNFTMPNSDVTFR